MKTKELEARLNKHFVAQGSDLGKMESKHGYAFEHQSRYMGDSIYSIAGLYADDTRKLFLKFIAQQEGVEGINEDKRDPIEGDDDSQ